MFKRIFFTALIAGLIAGIAISVVQEITTTPVIIHAEQFENSGPAGGHSHSALPDRSLNLIGTAHAHGAAGEAEGWGPDDGIERTLYTTLANVLTGIGFALVLTALFVFSGRKVDGRTGVLWGAAAFTAVSLAPSLGLPPEVPGAMAAELGARQAWWLFCVAATAGGLWLMVFRRNAWVLAGLALLALPHLVGAPHPESIGGAVPPELAAHFVAASLVTAAVFWCLLGWLSGTLWARFAESENTAH